MKKQAAEVANSKEGIASFHDKGTRIRILEEFDSPGIVSVVTHRGTNDNRVDEFACRESLEGELCMGCDDDNLKSRERYGITIYNVEENRRELMFEAINGQWSPMFDLLAYFEKHGDTLMDRDYIITRTGSGIGMKFTVTPQAPQKFNLAGKPKGLPYSRKKKLDLIKRAYPIPADYKQSVNDDYDYAADDDYDNKTNRELYDICKSRNIAAETHKDVDYYINLLRDEDAKETDQSSAVDYTQISRQELWSMLNERGIETPKGRTQKFYIAKLEEDDKARDVWKDDEVDEDEEDFPDSFFDEDEDIAETRVPKFMEIPDGETDEMELPWSEPDANDWDDWD